MGTLGLGMFLNRRTSLATCTKCTLWLGFPILQGQHVLFPGLKTSHMWQIPSC